MPLLQEVLVPRQPPAARADRARRQRRDERGDDEGVDQFACEYDGRCCCDDADHTHDNAPAAMKGKKRSEGGSPSDKAPPPTEAQAAPKRPCKKRARASVVKHEPVEEGLNRQQPGTWIRGRRVRVRGRERRGEMDVDADPHQKQEPSSPPGGDGGGASLSLPYLHREWRVFFVPTAAPMDKALGGASPFGAEGTTIRPSFSTNTLVRNPRSSRSSGSFSSAPFHPSFPPAAAPAHPQGTARRASRRSQRSSPQPFIPPPYTVSPAPVQARVYSFQIHLPFGVPPQAIGIATHGPTVQEPPPGKLAITAAIVDDSPFSFHPPEQPTSVGGYSGYSGSSEGGNPRKRTLGGPDGPYGAHTDHDEHEYGGSKSRPQSRRLSVMELSNERDERPTSFSLGLPALRRTGSAERDQREREQHRLTATNGLISRASALILHDGGDLHQQWEHEPRQHAVRRQGGSAASVGARAAYAGLMRRHQEVQLRQALDQQQQADAMTVGYHQQAQFYHHQQQQELEERYHQLQQQLHQQQQDGMYHAYHHIEAQGDPQELAYPPDSISAAAVGYHTHGHHPHLHHLPPQLETHALEGGGGGGLSGLVLFARVPAYTTAGVQG
ncbi:hypothetical protein MSAN_02485800 [Mycena sanguinolenta]|uniref:Uncharacterized protein n=1 Tax=Mycena sanguinolenta TaxID=230812 RepID=A0A8H6U3A4_9AGAR|nr:hypothetical protein MSAN_02485800 [Mycena sanguinolenta]